MVKVVMSPLNEYRVIGYTLATLLASMLPSMAIADTDDIINSNINRQQQSSASQTRIDQLADETDGIISQYHQQRA